jgi:uncharacterized repeat protein (TIGR03803 family)
LVYGTTFNGGLYSRGEVFELTPTVGGGWSESVPYNFYSNVALGLDCQFSYILRKSTPRQRAMYG